jgi:hypothetical protein
MPFARSSARLAIALVIACASGCAIPIIGAPSQHTARSAERERPRASAHATPARAARAQRSTPGLMLPPRERDAGSCEDALASAGVRFERVAESAANGVEQPVRLTGPLLSWAPTLRRAGVARIEHYSMYRPGARVGGSGRESGHARGLAIDAARFYLRNGSVLDVLTDWEERDHGGAPCPRRPEEAWPSRLLRGIVCDAVDQQLFQIVITPHHDHAHDNHVHLERKPEVSWTYVR